MTILIGIMVWRRSVDKLLSEQIMVNLYINIFASLGLVELKPQRGWLPSGGISFFTLFFLMPLVIATFRD